MRNSFRFYFAGGGLLILNYATTGMKTKVKLFGR